MSPPILPGVFLLGLLGLPNARETDATAGGVDFQREILPLLVRSCFECHGPDAETRKADLRLDGRSDVLADRGGYAVVVPGERGESELYLRVQSESDPMPPRASGKELTTEEVERLGRWIDQGAPWERHWAYVAPSRAEVPRPQDGGWIRTPIDAFVLERMRAAGLSPTPEAERTTLLRRASLDLTGLPPSLAEIDAFARDHSPDAYERMLDRLLASPAWGEHQARAWLDLARYADTNGYEKDERRTMWRYRDWVIDAFNADMPFDRFTIEQLAGDLLEEPTTEQLIATGFHRNTMLNREGGADPEEFRVAAVVDRTNTTASAWLGSTLACAQCHSHKYDPFTQEEYYQLFAFFDSTEDDGKEAAPEIRSPTARQVASLAALEREQTRLTRRLAGPDSELDVPQHEWEQRVRAGPRPVEWCELEPLRASSLHGTTLEILPDHSVLASGELPARDRYTIETRPGETRIEALRLEMLRDPGRPGSAVGRHPDGNFVVSGVEVEVLPAAGAFERLVPRLVAARSPYRQTNIDHRPLRAIDGDSGTGWAVAGFTERNDVELLLLPAQSLELAAGDTLRVNVLQESPFERYLVGQLRVSVTGDARIRRDLEPLEWATWSFLGPVPTAAPAAAPAAANRQRSLVEESYVAGALDPTSEGWSERAEWADGSVHAFEPEKGAFYLHRRVTSAYARRVLLRLGSGGALDVWVNGRHAFAHEVQRAAGFDQDRVEVGLSAGENDLLLEIVNHGGPTGFSFAPDEPQQRQLSARLFATASRPAAQRSAQEAAELRSWYRRQKSDAGRALHAELEGVGRRIAELEAAIPRTMILRERREPRQTRVLARGSFLSPGRVVERDVPKALHGWPPGAPRDREGLARWLVSPRNPLTPRVVVNRAWERIFGTGLVGTSDDFGIQGERPSHPELLDWLAVELVERGWSMKELHRMITTSATYRQSARARPELFARDPRNRLLARGPRLRVEAEVVRDLALAAAGLLDDTLGGPSVFPPQPPGVWSMTYSADDWVDDTGPNRFRRGLYTFWRRTAPYPTFATFDAPSRELACTRRPRTNTPLQALATLNDPVFVEAAAGLARRMHGLAGKPIAERATLGFRLCTGRPPHADELAILVDLYRTERTAFESAPELAGQLLAQGASDAHPTGAAAELAAWLVVANVLLNLDETLTKG